MDTPTNANDFSTRDLWVAAALLAAGHKLTRLDWRQGRAAFFVFSDADGCRESADQYWRRDLHVVAKDFADALRTLKDRLFAREHNNGDEHDPTAFRRHRD